jgi:hypothetical protein
MDRQRRRQYKSGPQAHVVQHGFYEIRGRPRNATHNRKICARCATKNAMKEFGIRTVPNALVSNG